MLLEGIEVLSIMRSFNSLPSLLFGISNSTSIGAKITYKANIEKLSVEPKV
jgi:hypothetical protein